MMQKKIDHEQQEIYLPRLKPNTHTHTHTRTSHSHSHVSCDYYEYAFLCRSTQTRTHVSRTFSPAGAQRLPKRKYTATK